MPRASESVSVAPQRIPWSQLGPSFIHSWGYPERNGKRLRMPEHVEVLGQNGSGKTYWMLTVLKERARVRRSDIVFIFTKADDDTVTALGWPVITSWPPDYKDRQVIFHAKGFGLSKEGKARQKAKLIDLLSKLWRPKANVIVVFDEIAYVSIDLDMRTELTTYYREGRALGITIMAGTQRAQGVTRYMHSESAWTVAFAPKDEADAERMAEVLGSKRIYKPILMTLDRTKFEFLIVHNSTGKMYISWIDPPRKKREGKATKQAR